MRSLFLRERESRLSSSDPPVRRDAGSFPPNLTASHLQDRIDTNSPTKRSLCPAQPVYLLLGSCLRIVGCCEKNHIRIPFLLSFFFPFSPAPTSSVFQRENTPLLLRMERSKTKNRYLRRSFVVLSLHPFFFVVPPMGFFFSAIAEIICFLCGSY